MIKNVVYEQLEPNINDIWVYVENGKAGIKVFENGKWVSSITEKSNSNSEDVLNITDMLNQINEKLLNLPELKQSKTNTKTVKQDATLDDVIAAINNINKILVSSGIAKK